MPNGAAAQSWLLEVLVAQLASVLEIMAGERPTIECQAAPDAPSGGLTWRQPFAGAPGEVWIQAAESDFAALGGHILLAAGLDETDADSVKSTYLETLSQALAGLAQAISGKLNVEVTPQGGQEKNPGEPERGEADAKSPSLEWSRAEVRLPSRSAVLQIGFEKALVDAITAGDRPQKAIETPAPIDIAAPGGPITSRTFDLLLDVELPVSVSFGRAQVQLKDVLKLTTGSIIELNRAITEPVEVIVNNCVIARGEVVVVEGNFGVRIQQVISRQERLRTLY